jgi:hypothetical protein
MPKKKGAKDKLMSKLKKHVQEEEEKTVNTLCRVSNDTYQVRIG